MQKRSILLTLFLLLGFLPTLGLFLLGIYRQTDLYVKNCGSAAGELLELPVEIGGISHQIPGEGRIWSLTVFQPGLASDGQKTPLVKVPRADWTEYSIWKDGKEIHLTKWILPEVTFDKQCLEPLWMVHHHLLSKPNAWAGKELSIQVEGPVQVGFEEDSLRLYQGEMRIRQEAGVPQTDIVFHVPEMGREAQIRLNLRRIVQNSSQVVQATFTTDSGGIPVRFLTSIFPMLQSLGSASRFTGSIAIQQSFSRWSGFFQGRFDQVNAAAFFPNGELVGTGTLQIEKARFDGAQLMLADGDFRLRQGTVSRHFLQKVTRTTQLAFRRVPESADPLVFQELAFRFQIRDSQMQIFGNCQGYEAGIFLTDSQGPILGEPTFLRKPFSRAVFEENLLKQEKPTP